MTFEETVFDGLTIELADIGANMHLGTIPQDPGDRIGITFYPVQDHGTMTDGILGAQIITRADSTDTRHTGRLTTAVFDRLHGLRGIDWPGHIHIVHCYRNSGTDLGPDDNGRTRHTQNYYLQHTRPGPHRTDT